MTDDLSKEAKAGNLPATRHQGLANPVPDGVCKYCESLSSFPGNLHLLLQHKHTVISLKPPSSLPSDPALLALPAAVRRHNLTIQSHQFPSPRPRPPSTAQPPSLHPRSTVSPNLVSIRHVYGIYLIS